jgi:transposase
VGVDRARRYPSDLTDARWEIIEPMLPLARWMGRPEKHPRRAVIDAILYVLCMGCPWRYMPGDFPPRADGTGTIGRLNERGVIDRMLAGLRERVRLAHDRAPEPTVGIIDS